MHHTDERPFGISAMAIVLAIKGIASIAMAFDLVTFGLRTSSNTDQAAAGAALITGLLLLYKAYGLWSLHRTTWLVLVVLVALDGMVAAGELLLGTRTATVWFSLAVSLVTVFYLLQPDVRNSFLADHNDSIGRRGDR